MAANPGVTTLRAGQDLNWSKGTVSAEAEAAYVRANSRYQAQREAAAPSGQGDGIETLKCHATSTSGALSAGAGASTGSLVTSDGTINLLASAMRDQRLITDAYVSAFNEGSYGQAAAGLLLATANVASVAAGAAAQLVIGAPYNAGFDASSGFYQGDYDRALKGSTELLLIAGGDKLLKAAAWTEDALAGGVRRLLADPPPLRGGEHCSSGDEAAGSCQHCGKSGGPNCFTF